MFEGHEGRENTGYKIWELDPKKSNNYCSLVADLICNSDSVINNIDSQVYLVTEKNNPHTNNELSIWTFDSAQKYLQSVCVLYTNVSIEKPTNSETLVTAGNSLLLEVDSKLYLHKTQNNICAEKN